MQKKIKVLIVDDSAVARDFLEKGITRDPQIEVIGKASNAYAARDKIFFKNPDVITLDIEMPGINGLDFLKKLMAQQPMPVVMVSGMTETGSKITLEALEAGAVDFVPKASIEKGITPDQMIMDLIAKIKIAANIYKAKLVPKKIFSTQLDHNKNLNELAGFKNKTDYIIAIGASTGGTDAIAKIISDIKDKTPGIIIVQHMPPVFTRMFAERINKITNLQAKEAEDGDLVRNNSIYIAPGGYHMRLIYDHNKFFLECTKGENVNGHSPSVDVLFDSVAIAAKTNAMGIILTGMGKDGAKGLLNMKNQGAYTIAQDEKSSIVFGMPMEAHKIGASNKLVNLDSIAGEISKYVITKKIFETTQQ